MRRLLFSLAIGFLAIASSAQAQVQSLWGPKEFNGIIRFSVEGKKALALQRNVGNVLSKSSALSKSSVLSRPSVLQRALLKKDASVLKPTTTTSPVPKIPTSFAVNVKQPLDIMSKNAVTILQKMMNERRPHFRGFGAYNVVIRRGTPVLKALVINNSIELEYVLTGNYMESSFTTPDIVNVKIPILGRVKGGLGGYADPRFSLRFDLTFRATVTPQLHGLPSVTRVKVTPSNPQLDSRNFAADLMKAGSELSGFVGGPDFLRMAEKSISDQELKSDDPLKGTFTGINNRLAPMMKDAKALYVRHESNRIHIVYSTDPPYVPVLR